MWQYTGSRRPDFADAPAPDQESVWDYPRPPAVVPCDRRVEVFAGPDRIASTRHCLRVLETASPPTYYLPAEDVNLAALTDTAGRSFCEWKGAARYYALAAAPDMPVAWSYPEPVPAYADLTDHLAFYPARVACFVDGERVRPQPASIRRTPVRFH